MKQGFRLRRSVDFDRTLRSRRSAASAYLALFVGDNGLGRPRVGFVVSRKLGNAIIRNRVKRRLRELTRLLAINTQAGQDVVIVARARAIRAEYARLKEELEVLWTRAVRS